MDLQRIRSRFTQFGGFRLVREYARLGILPVIGSAFVRCLISSKPLKGLNAVVLQHLEPFLIEKYLPVLLERKAYYDGITLEHKRSNVVWFCWLQGFSVVCVSSIQKIKRKNGN